jgi:hypothetical protein
MAVPRRFLLLWVGSDLRVSRRAGLTVGRLYFLFPFRGLRGELVVHMLVLRKGSRRVRVSKGHEFGKSISRLVSSERSETDLDL